LQGPYRKLDSPARRPLPRGAGSLDSRRFDCQTLLECCRRIAEALVTVEKPKREHGSQHPPHCSLDPRNGSSSTALLQAAAAKGMQEA